MSSALDEVNSINTKIAECNEIVGPGDGQEIAAWQRVASKNVKNAAHEAKDWAALEEWGQGLDARAQGYTDKSDRQLVQKASGEIDLGATDGESALKHVSIANQELLSFSAVIPRVRKQRQVAPLAARSSTLEMVSARLRR